MWIIDIIVKLFRLCYNIFIHFIITINRWVTFLVHLTMMFFVWNSLLIVIGIVQTTQMTIGLGRDISSLTSSPTSIKNPKKDEKDTLEGEKVQTYWQKRRKVYQEMIDGLYIKYMERLVEIQQGQAKYWQFDNNNYIYPQSRYYNYYYDENIEEGGEGQETIEDNGENSSDTSSGGAMEFGNGVANDQFIPPIKITEDTSISTF